MNREFVERILQLTPLRQYLRWTPLLDETKEELIDVCSDRAVLLPELHETVLQTHLHISGDELITVRGVARTVLYELAHEVDTPGKYIPRVLHRGAQNYDVWLSETRPKHWTWLEMVASGVAVNGWHMGVALSCVFEEAEAIQADRHSLFQHRCRASGLEQLLPTAIVDRSKQDTADRRFSRGPPRKRIRSIHSTVRRPSETCWRFTGHLQNEAQLRTQLASIEGSWASTRSAWHAWAAFMDATLPCKPHFHHITEAQVGSFASFFDAPATLKKYLGHLKKAALLLGCEFPGKPFLDRVVRGAQKFVPKSVKSYITADAVAQFTEHLVAMRRVDLAQFVSVVYTFQLRVQSEALGLQFDGRPRDGSSTKWHSAVEVGRDKVTIVLRVRKNSLEICRIERKCTCRDWPGKVICGVCSLRLVVRRAGASDGRRIFPGVCSSDIRILKTFGASHNVGPVTWHGFRRGRTCDLLERGGSNGTCISLAEIYQSGGWKYGSSALLSYIPEAAVHRERAFRFTADASDTDAEHA